MVRSPAPRLYSIAKTAKANEFKPYEYFTYLLEQLMQYPRNNVPEDKLLELMPWSKCQPIVENYKLGKYTAAQSGRRIYCLVLVIYHLRLSSWDLNIRRCYHISNFTLGPTKAAVFRWGL
jgi:hypothetical protein